MNLDKILNEWAFRCPDGIVDLNNNDKLNILQNILNEYNIPIDIVKELKGINIKKGEKFTLIEDIGLFKKGDNILVNNIKLQEEDVLLEVIDEKGNKDYFHVDYNDVFENINESLFIEE